MQSKDIVLFKKADILVFLLVILLSLALFLSAFSGEDNVKLVINANGNESVYMLNENKSIDFDSDGISLTVVIENGYAFVKSSSCRDKICINSGKISKDGQIIVCAPAHFSMKIVGGEGGYDAISG